MFINAGFILRKVDPIAIRISIDLTLDPSTTFYVVAEELKLALARLGMRFEPGSKGHLIQGEFEVGRITSWVQSDQ